MLGLLLQVIAMGGELASPLFIGAVVQAISEKKWETVNMLSYIWIAVAIVQSIFAGFQAYLFGCIAQIVGMQVRDDLFQDIISKDVEFFDSRKTGDLLSRL